MPIQKIVFGDSLLLKHPVQAQNIKTETIKPEEIKQDIPQEQPVATEVIAEEKPNHTVRNWSIGLGAAATLIALGVAGRNGHLGKGLQKLLGGAEKDSGKMADELASGVGTHTSGSTHAPSGSPKPETPIETPKTETPVETQKPETQTAQKPEKPVDAPKALETPIKRSGAPMTDAEIKAIDESLDRTMPKVTKDMLVLDKSLMSTPVDTYEKLIFDTLKIPKTGTPNAFQIFTHEGKEVEARFGSGGQLSSVDFASLNGEKIKVCLQLDAKVFNVDNYSSGINRYYYGKNMPEAVGLRKGGNKLHYNNDGKLRSIFVNNSEGETIKSIWYQPGTTNIKEIEYYQTTGNTFSTNKIEYFADGKLIKETFYKEPGKRQTACVLEYA